MVRPKLLVARPNLANLSLVYRHNAPMSAISVIEARRRQCLSTQATLIQSYHAKDNGNCQLCFTE